MNVFEEHAKIVEQMVINKSRQEVIIEELASKEDDSLRKELEQLREEYLVLKEKDVRFDSRYKTIK